MEDDKKLIFAYLNGDSNAFSLLVSKYLKSVYNFAFWFSHDPVMSEDITQESFVKIWKNLDKFKSDQNFKTWLFSIVRNTAFDWLRKRKNIPFSDLNDDGEDGDSFEDNIVDSEIAPLESIFKAEEKIELENAVNKLSSKYKEIVILHIFEDLTFDEISKVLDKSLNTVKSQYRRALISLRDLLSI